MMRSLYSGVAGLRTHQTKMDVLGNNIANVNTTSFKSQSITFSDLMYQTTQSASGATATKGGTNARQIGLGAKSGAIATAIESQGATQTTNNPFDLMITGKAFFIVNNGKENLYTRDGSFYVDGAGNLAVQANGYLVQGWKAQEDSETGEITVNKNGGLTKLQIMSADNTTYSPASTTAALFSGNIDDNDTNVTSDDGKTITLEFYDNKGYLYTGKFVLKDTGTEDLFSLELTDILDSSGYSIGKTLMDAITFGSTQSNDVKFTTAYEVIPGATTSTVNLLAGATVYESVPLTGALSDLMTSSKASYAGILERIYGISDTMITSGANGYSKTSAYTLDENGNLTITYDKEIATAKPNGYTFTSQNTNSYYVNKDKSGIAYQVPTISTATMNTASKSLETTLKKVFGMTDTEFSTYSNDNKYQYTFTSNQNGNDTFTVYRDPSLSKAATATQTSTGNLSKYYDDFPGLQAAIGSETGTLFYTFDDNRKLTVYGSQPNSEVKSTANNTTVTTLNKLTTNNLYTYANLDNDQKSELASLLYAAGIITANDVDTLAAYMGGTNQYLYFKIEAITGTNGISFYKTEPGDVVNTADVKYSDTAYSKTFTADETTYPVSTKDELGGVFVNTSDGSAYVLEGDEDTLSDYSEKLLKAVYNIEKSSYSSKLQVNIAASGGQITLFDTLTVNPTLNSDYAAKMGEDGKLIYVTTNDTLAWKDLPNSGNIVDLKATATGEYRGLLKAVYGLTDEDADAYGSDGTYEINADGSITLTTGEKTIQLKFNPANGAITTANGKDSGLVNIVFDQSVPGLEAFGFQPTTADEEELRGKLTVDFSTITNYNTSGSSTIKVVKGDKQSLNTGRMVGEMNGITVATDGQIHATYSNGQTKLLGQIASAEFANASGLAKEGDNLYSATLNSGEATVQDITTDGGYMNTGVLEMSNVDLSKEFTEMITTQRGFQANSRIITVSDTLLEELTNLKR